MPKQEVSVEYLRNLTMSYMELLDDKTWDADEWAYVMLEPDLLIDAAVTLAFLRTLNREEFEALGPYYDDIVRKWKDPECVRILEEHYRTYCGESRDTEFYNDYLCSLRGYIL